MLTLQLQFGERLHFCWVWRGCNKPTKITFAFPHKRLQCGWFVWASVQNTSACCVAWRWGKGTQCAAWEFVMVDNLINNGFYCSIRAVLWASEYSSYRRCCCFVLSLWIREMQNRDGWLGSASRCGSREFSSGQNSPELWQKTTKTKTNQSPSFQMNNINSFMRTDWRCPNVFSSTCGWTLRSWYEQPNVSPLQGPVFLAFWSFAFCTQLARDVRKRHLLSSVSGVFTPNTKNAQRLEPTMLQQQLVFGMETFPHIYASRLSTLNFLLVWTQFSGPFCLKFRFKL